MRKQAGLLRLMGEIGLNQRAQTSDHHLVADTQDDGPVVTVRFDQGCEGGGAEVPVNSA